MRRFDGTWAATGYTLVPVATARDLCHQMEDHLPSSAYVLLLAHDCSPRGVRDPIARDQPGRERAVETVLRPEA